MKSSEKRKMEAHKVLITDNSTSKRTADKSTLEYHQGKHAKLTEKDFPFLPLTSSESPTVKWRKVEDTPTTFFEFI